MPNGLNIVNVMLLLLLPATVFLVVVAMTIAWVQNKMEIERAINPVSAEDALPSTAACVGDRVVIGNKSDYYWFNVKIEVNGVYVYAGDAIPRGETMRYYHHIFTKADGTRLNLRTTACNTIDIHVDDENGNRQHRNFGREGERSRERF